MNAWFEPQTAPLFSLSSLLALLAILAPMVKQGKYKAAVTVAYASALAIGLGFLAVAAVAFYTRQPYYVAGALFICGSILTAIFGVLLPMVRAAYRAAERRKIVAENL